MYRILNNISPTEEEVREWALDEDSLLTEQDEDLILYSGKYAAVLFELACDMNCPKSEYCLSILSNYSKSLFLANELTPIHEIGAIIEVTASTLPPRCLEWINHFKRCKILLEYPQSIDLKEADNIAHYLLKGDQDCAVIRRTGETLSCFVEYVKSGTYKTYLYINLANARWVFSRFQRLSNSTFLKH